MLAKSNKKMKLMGLLATVAFSAALMLCALPGAAFATDFTDAVSTSSVQVRIGDNTNPVSTVSFSTAGIQSGQKGALYNKTGVWSVVGTDSYVTLQSVLDQVGEYDGYWTSVTFYCYNSSTNTYSNYTKFNSGIFPYATTGTIAGLSLSLPFYEDTTYNALGTTERYAYTPIIALNNATTTLSGSTTAQQALDNMTFTTTDAPRLMWGYDANNVGGNRFPSNIVGIQVNE